MDQAAIPATIDNLARLTAKRIKAAVEKIRWIPDSGLSRPKLGIKRLGRDQDADLNDVPDQGGQHHGQQHAQHIRRDHLQNVTQAIGGVGAGERARSGSPQRIGHHLGERPHRGTARV